MQVSPWAGVKIIFRALLAVMTLAAGVWIWETIVLSRMKADQNAYYEAHVVPQLAAWKQRMAEFDEALKDRKSGKITPLPDLQTMDNSILRTSIDPSLRQYPVFRTKSYAEMVFFSSAFLLLITGLVGQYLRRREREAPERPADQDAGLLVGELVQQNKEFSAKAGVGTGNSAVTINGQRAIVAFRNFAFVHAFVGNPNLELVELPFSEILAVSPWSSKGRRYLTVRTTRGRIMVGEDVQPFQTLADVLSDIVELNRTSPEAYAAALAREPKIQTPWWGWLIIAVGLGAIGYMVWKGMIQ